MSLPARAAIMAIGFYRKWLSPLLPPLCIYEPTCSQYMLQAIARKGFLRGVALGVWRLLRCNPFSRGGWDPVDPSDKPTYLGREAGQADNRD